MRVGLLFFTGLLMLAFSSTTFAEALDFNMYGRGSMQIGKKGYNGERIDGTGGFAQGTRLLETQYLELSGTAKLPSDTRLKFTLSSSSNSPNYTWTNADFAIPELFLEFQKLPDASQYSLWFGSRMYRGDDIYLFDTWPLDSQNMLGAGVAYNGSQTIEFAVGATSDSPYQASGTGNVSNYSSKSQRLIFINKMAMPMAGGQKLKTNVEFNLIPSGQASLSANTNTYTLDTPLRTGVMLGVQYAYLPGHNLFVNYGRGYVNGGVWTPSYNVTSLTSTSGATINPTNVTSKESSQNLSVALGGSEESAKLKGGLLYGFYGRLLKPGNGGTAGLATTAAVRPMYYVTDHLHAGMEVDAIIYAKRMNDATDINYFQVAPMLEYALNKNVYGSPKIRLIASNVFYGTAVQHYDTSSKYAFNLATGFEVWF